MSDYRENTIQGLVDMNSLIFNVLSMLMLSATTASLTGVVPLLPMFMRDKEKRLYSAGTFYIISTIYRIPLYAILVALFMGTTCIFTEIDLGDNLSKVPKYYLIMFLSYFSFSSVGDILSVVLMDMSSATNAIASVLLPMYLMAGFLAKVKDTAFYIQIISYLSPMKFSYQAMAITQYTYDIR